MLIFEDNYLSGSNINSITSKKRRVNRSRANKKKRLNRENISLLKELGFKIKKNGRKNPSS